MALLELRSRDLSPFSICPTSTPTWCCLKRLTHPRHLSEDCDKRFSSELRGKEVPAPAQVCILDPAGNQPGLGGHGKEPPSSILFLAQPPMSSMCGPSSLPFKTRFWAWPPKSERTFRDSQRVIAGKGLTHHSTQPPPHGFHS